MKYKELAELWVRQTPGYKKLKNASCTALTYRLHGQDILTRISKNWALFDAHGWYSRTTQAHVNRVCDVVDIPRYSQRDLHALTYLQLYPQASFFNVLWDTPEGNMLDEITRLKNLGYTVAFIGAEKPMDRRSLFICLLERARQQATLPVHVIDILYTHGELLTTLQDTLLNLQGVASNALLFVDTKEEGISLVE